MAKSTREDTLDALIDFLKVWHDLAPELTVNATLSFMVAARRSGEVTLADVIKVTGVTKETASRSVQMFEKINRHKQFGFDMLEAKVDPMKDQRFKPLFLTRQGRAFVERLLEPIRRKFG